MNKNVTPQMTTDDLFDPCLVQKTSELMAAAMGDERARRDAEAESLGINPDTFSRNLKHPEQKNLVNLARISKTLARIQSQHPDQTIVIPVNGEIRSSDPRVLVYDQDAWNRDTQALMSRMESDHAPALYAYADQVVGILNQVEVDPNDVIVRKWLLLVGSSVLTWYGSWRLFHGERSCLSLHESKLFPPVMVNGISRSPLGQFLLWRHCDQTGQLESYINRTAELTVDMVFKNPGSPIKASDTNSKRVQLGRWLRNAKKGGRPHSDFVCFASERAAQIDYPEYAYPCRQDDLALREKFESALTVHHLYCSTARLFGRRHQVAVALWNGLVSIPYESTNL